MKHLALPGMLLVASCGLISSDITAFKLKFPEKSFKVNTADWNLTVTGTAPNVPCGAGGATCAQASSQFCSAGDCTVNCDGTYCQAHVNVSLVQSYDLSRDAPEYQQIANHSVVTVGVDDIYVKVTENTLNVSTPTLNVYMAPASVMSATDAAATLIGTMPPIPAGTTGRIDFNFTAGGQATLARYMGDFHTPFNVIVAGTATIRGGEPVPEGRLVGAVTGDAHASL